MSSASNQVVARLRRSRFAARMNLPDPFHVDNDQHLNTVASGLLQCFRQDDDVEAYSFLVELMHQRLLRMAGGIGRRQVLLIDADDLVARLMARLFTDVRKDQPVVRQFLALAYTTMRYDAINQLRLQRRARQRGEAWEQMRASDHSPVDPITALDDAERDIHARQLSAVFLAVVNHCFHGLPDRDRRVLTLREIDGLSYDQLAVTMDLPRPQVGMVLRRARKRLSRHIHQAMLIPIRPRHRNHTTASTPS